MKSALRDGEPLHRSSALTTRRVTLEGLVLHYIIGVGLALAGVFPSCGSRYFFSGGVPPCQCLFRSPGHEGLIISTSKQYTDGGGAVTKYQESKSRARCNIPRPLAGGSLALNPGLRRRAARHTSGPMAAHSSGQEVEPSQSSRQ